MIKREAYMSRIRPFIGGELIKVITGIRRSGKSVMLELIKDELAAAGVGRESVVSINFEDMRFARLLTARALHDEIASRVKQIEGKAYLFSTKSRRSRTGRSASTPSVSSSTATFI